MFDHWTASQDILLKRNPNYSGTAGYVDAIHFEYSVTPTTGRAQGAERRRRPARRLHPAGQLPAADRQPAVEEPGRGRAGRRAQLPVPEHHRQAVRQPARAPGASPGRSTAPRSSSCSRAPASPSTRSTRPACPATSTAPPATSTATTRPRPNSSWARRASPTASRRRSTQATSHPGPRSCSRSSTTSHRSASRLTIKLLDQSSYWALIGKKGAAGIGMNNWWMDYPDPFDFISGMLSKSTAINQGSNPSFWWDPKIETDLVQAQVDARPGRPAGAVRPDAVLHHEPGADRAAVPVRGHDAALQAHAAASTCTRSGSSTTSTTGSTSSSRRHSTHSPGARPA